jgi:hypothetical protein
VMASIPMNFFVGAPPAASSAAAATTADAAGLIIDLLGSPYTGLLIFCRSGALACAVQHCVAVLSHGCSRGAELLLAAAPQARILCFSTTPIVPECAVDLVVDDRLHNISLERPSIILPATAAAHLFDRAPDEARTASCEHI